MCFLVPRQLRVRGVFGTAGELPLLLYVNTCWVCAGWSWVVCLVSAIEGLPQMCGARRVRMIYTGVSVYCVLRGVPVIVWVVQQWYFMVCGRA